MEYSKIIEQKIIPNYKQFIFFKDFCYVKNMAAVLCSQTFNI